MEDTVTRNMSGHIFSTFQKNQLVWKLYFLWVTSLYLLPFISEKLVSMEVALFHQPRWSFRLLISEKLVSMEAAFQACRDGCSKRNFRKTSQYGRFLSNFNSISLFFFYFRKTSQYGSCGSSSASFLNSANLFQKNQLVWKRVKMCHSNDSHTFGDFRKTSQYGRTNYYRALF